MLRKPTRAFLSAKWRKQQQQLATVILKDPAIESISSFIGIDGTNTTLNAGRIQINLKPLEDRGINASDVIRRLQPELAKIDGITLYMQPVQDLSVEDRVSRTEFQYSLEDPNADELSRYATKFVAKLETLPELADVASDLQTRGLQAALNIDRQTASRLGITAQSYRSGALRRLRSTPSIHAVHTTEPIPRNSGSETRLPVASGAVRGHLH